MNNLQDSSFDTIFILSSLIARPVSPRGKTTPTRRLSLVAEYRPLRPCRDVMKVPTEKHAIGAVVLEELSTCIRGDVE
jgi:hypothetical protein